ncbi:MAG: XylR N-terminal domain-containing protein, partial [Clostridia bacterium]|nr:XylR N-terminal domain-containing protein [Clostridia bacterium]
MKATDFNLSKELKFNLDEGVTSFRDSRIAIFDTNAIGLLRQSIVKEFGRDKARELFLK